MNQARVICRKGKLSTGAEQRPHASVRVTHFSRDRLCDAMDPPGSSVPGILWARILQWAAVPTSRGSSRPRDGICISRVSYIAGGFFTTEPPGKPTQRSDLRKCEKDVNRMEPANVGRKARPVTMGGSDSGLPPQSTHGHWTPVN